MAIAIVLGLVIGVGQSAYSQTQSSPDPSVSDIVQSGKLRIGVFPSFQYSKDASGKPQGLALGIANALAAGMSIREVVTVEYPTPPQVIACVKEGGCDVGFMLVDPARAKEVDFTPAFVRSDFTYLVPPGLPLKTAADVDRPGIRIAVVRGHASTISLVRIIKRRSQCTRTPMIQHLNYCGPGRQTHLRPYARCLSNTRHSFLARGS